jgi:hypothetical protein
MIVAVVSAFASDTSLEAKAERIAIAASCVTSWDVVARLLHLHGCSLIAYQLFGLPEVRARAIPPDEFLAALRRRYAAAVAGFYGVLPQLREVSGGFADAGIPTMAFKGIAVGAMLYDDPILREFSDLDFVVPESSAREADAALRGLGYVCVDDPFCSPPRYDGESLRSATYCRSGSICADLRFDPLRILWKSKGTREALFARWWGRRRQLEIGTVPLQVPGFEDSFMQLARHLQAHDFARAKWVADMLLLLRRHGAELAWDEIGREAHTYGIHGGLYRTLEVLDEVYGASVPVAAWRALRPNRAVRTLHRRAWPTSLAHVGTLDGPVANLTPQSLRLRDLRQPRQRAALMLFIIDRNRIQNLTYLVRRLFPSRGWLQAHHSEVPLGTSYAALWVRHVRGRVGGHSSGQG